MGFFDKLKDAFSGVKHVVEEAGHELNPDHVIEVLEQGVESTFKKLRSEVLKKLPGHLSLHEAVDIIKATEPSQIDLDVFAGFGVDIGIELNLQFDMGITVNQPAEKIEALVDIIEHPPATVHALCDKLWGIVPDEVRIGEQLQAIVGESGVCKWEGEDVMQRVTEYIGRRGWLEHSLRP